MRQLFLAIPLALSGCMTTGVPQVDQIVAQVQERTVAACGYLPAAESILAIVNRGELATALAVAQAICAAVSQPTLRTATRTVTRTVTVSGVAVQGQFVR